MEDYFNLKSFEKKFPSSMRNSPLYFECRCKEIEMIKKNLSVACETINKLREENSKIRQMLSKEYQEKIQALENESVYLKYLLKKAESSEPNKKLLQRLENLQENCQKKDKIIEIQEKKLHEISSSVKNQVKDIKNIVELNISLENELKKAKKLENPEVFRSFADFFKFSKSLDNKVLYKTAKSCLGSSNELSKDLKNHKCVKVTQKLLKLCRKLMRFIDYNKSFNPPKDPSFTDDKTQAKTTDSTNNEGKPNISLESSLKLSKQQSLSSSSRIPRLSNPVSVTQERKADENQSIRSSVQPKPVGEVFFHSKDQKSHESVKSLSQGVRMSDCNSSKSEMAVQRSKGKSSKNLPPEPEPRPALPSQSSVEEPCDESSRSSIVPIAEEIPIFPKDYSTLFQEGEQLLKLIDSQNCRLSKLSKVITEAYENPSPQEDSHEISSGPSLEETAGNVETFQRKRSRWNTNNSPTPNLRIPLNFDEISNEVNDEVKETTWTANNQQWFKKNGDLEGRREKKIQANHSETSLNTKKSRNDFRVGKGCRNSPDRFHEYVRPTMKSEKNWDSVEEFFNSD